MAKSDELRECEYDCYSCGASAIILGIPDACPKCGSEDIETWPLPPTSEWEEDEDGQE